MSRIFISFSSKQENEANRICLFLEKNGTKCFISSRDLIPGEEYASQLLENIDKSDAVLLILSKDANESPHVLREIEYAVSHRIPVLVYSFEEVELTKSMEYYLMTHQWIVGDNKDIVLLNAVSKIGNGENTRLGQKREESGSAKLTIKKIVIIFIVAFFVFSILLIVLIKTIDDKMETKSSTNGASSANLGENEIAANINIGDTIVFGSYYDEPIEWRVCNIDEDGTAMLLSKYILTMKAFDAPEGGTYNSYEGVDYWSYENHIIDNPELCKFVRGSNKWSDSNIRTWLNSDREVVNYKDQAPTKGAVGDNFYSSEPGFLCGFSEEERNCIVATTHEGVEDFVYLLSSDELKNLASVDISIYAKPTEKCIQHDSEKEYYNSFVEIYGIENYYWWLRDSDSDKANEVNIVATELEEDLEYIPASAGISNGVRPVINIDIKSLVDAQN